jgi:hypothetical protein
VTATTNRIFDAYLADFIVAIDTNETDVKDLAKRFDAIDITALDVARKIISDLFPLALAALASNRKHSDSFTFGDIGRLRNILVRAQYRLNEVSNPPIMAGASNTLPMRKRSEPPLYDRETLGRIVRQSWVKWAVTQPAPKPSWLVPYNELSEADKEADRQIGEAVACVMLREITRIKYERDQYKLACKQAGVCMTCAVSAPDTFGCSDCLNTGWEQGDPHEQIKLVEAERNTAKEEAGRLRSYISDAGYETIQSEQEWKRRAIAAENELKKLRENATETAKFNPAL